MSRAPSNTPFGQSLVGRVNTRIKSSDVLMQLITAGSRVIENRIVQPRSQLATIRSPHRYHRGDWITLPDEFGEGVRAIVNSIRQGGGDNGTDLVFAQPVGQSTGVEFSIDSNFKEKEVQIAGCRFHGFNYFSDMLTREDYARVHTWVEHYWPESGNQNFARFIGFIKNMTLNVHQLWSDEVPPELDYYPYLERVPRGVPVYDGGISYPTSHVELAYDPVVDPHVDLVDLFYLFYYLAPIHLVLERIVAEVETIIPITYATPPPFIRMDDCAVLHLDAEDFEPLYQAEVTPHQYIDALGTTPLDDDAYLIDGGPAVLP